jgi:WD40 repeat protein
MRYVGGVLVGAALLLSLSTGRGEPGPQPRAIRVMTSAVSPDGKYLALGYEDSGAKSAAGTAPLVAVYQLKDGKKAYDLTGHKRAVDYVAFTPDSKYLLSGGYDRTFRLWDVESGKVVRRFKASPGGNSCGCLSPNGKRLLVYVYDNGSKLANKFKLYSTKTGKLIKAFQCGKPQVRSMKWSRDGAFVLLRCQPLVDDPSMLKVLDIAKEKLLVSINGWKAHCTDEGCLSADGKFLIISREKPHPKDKRNVRACPALWNIAEDELERTFTPRKKAARPHSVSLTPNGKHLLTVDSDETVRLWSIAKGKELWAVKGKGSAPSFQANGKQFALAYAEVTARYKEVWHVVTYSLATGKVARTAKLGIPVVNP